MPFAISRICSGRREFGEGGQTAQPPEYHPFEGSLGVNTSTINHMLDEAAFTYVFDHLLLNWVGICMY